MIDDDLTMWPSQREVRTRLEVAAARALTAINITADPLALLVGFSTGKDAAIEIEAGSLAVSAADLAGCEERARRESERHVADELTTDETARHRARARSFDEQRCQAVSLALAGHALAARFRFFVGASRTVQDFAVHPVLAIPRDAWDGLPSLTRQDHVHPITTMSSFQSAVVHQLLLAAGSAIADLHGSSTTPLERGSDLLRQAATDFVDRLAYTRGEFTGELVSALDAVAAQPYEGRAGAGSILFGDVQETDLTIRFSDPIPLAETRAIRKTLEISTPSLHLVTDGKVAFGLGTVTSDHRPEDETVLTIRVMCRGVWQLQHHDKPLMRMEDGLPSVPDDPVERSTFMETVERTFQHGDAAQLWTLVEEARKQPHGTMLVVHDDAATEAARLTTSALRVEPAALRAEHVVAASSIDGAILVDPSGVVHAIGVILDGVAAAGVGDRSRGARFNSAHRYLNGQDQPCLIVVVSEDGMVNLMPDLPPRINRSDVDEPLDQLVALSEADPVDLTGFSHSLRAVHAVSRYLSEAQCDRANAAIEYLEQRRRAKAPDVAGAIGQVRYERLRAVGGVDETYFLPVP